MLEYNLLVWNFCGYLTVNCGLGNKSTKLSLVSMS